MIGHGDNGNISTSEMLHDLTNYTRCLYVSTAMGQKNSGMRGHTRERIETAVKGTGDLGGVLEAVHIGSGIETSSSYCFATKHHNWCPMRFKFTSLGCLHTVFPSIVVNSPIVAMILAYPGVTKYVEQD
jgi:hypothetical protein